MGRRVVFTGPAEARGGREEDGRDVGDADVVALTWDDGVRTFVRADTAAARFADPATSTGDSVLLSRWRAPDKGRDAARSVRLHEWKVLPSAGEAVASDVLGAAAKVDTLALEGVAPGLHRMTLEGTLEPATSAPPPRLLLLLHGAARGPAATFRPLANEGPDGREEWKAIHRSWDNAVYVWAWRPLTTDPIAAATELAAALPPRAELTLLTHGVGGLVGELLHLGGVTVLPEALAALGADPDRKRDIDGILALARTLAAAHIAVERVVRVAAPVRGVAAEDLCTWAARTRNVLWPGTAADNTTGVSGALESLAIAAARAGASTSSLPGLGALLPDRGLVPMLIGGTGPASGALVEVSSVVRDEFQRPLEEAHLARTEPGDLLVDVAATTGGIPRRHTLRHRGVVPHGAWFSTPTTGRVLLRALLALEDVGLEPMERGPRARTRGGGDGRGAIRYGNPGRDVVYLLPGILGSSLRRGLDVLWPDAAQLVWRGLDPLRDPAMPVAPHDLLLPFYAPMIEGLARRHEVVSFPYDWRADVFTSGKRLAAAVQAELHVGRKVHLVAHSLGGLVARAALATIDRSGVGAFIQLGTPNQGAPAMTRLLAGKDAFLDLLDIAVLPQGREHLLRVLVGWPAVLDLLPTDVLSSAHPVWSRVPCAPDGAALDAAGVRRRALVAIPLPKRFVYIAGCGASTPKEMWLDPLTWSPGDGDGQVPLDLGPPAGLAADASVPVAHVFLARAPAVVDAVCRYVDGGDLGLARPAQARAADEVAPRAATHTPTAEELVIAALGGTGPLQPEPQLRVRLHHASAEEADWPVLVGHASGDPVDGVAAVLDRTLGGELRRRIAGDDAASHVIVGRSSGARAHRAGAVVVPLGPAGTLTPMQLHRVVERAVLRYAAEWPSPQRSAAEDDPEPTPADTDLGLSAVLIGTRPPDALAVPIVVETLVSAVSAACGRLREQAAPRRLRELELVVVSEARAMQAWAVLRQLEQRAGLRLGFVLADAPERGATGRAGAAEERAGEAPWRQARVRWRQGRLEWLLPEGRARLEAQLLRADRAEIEEWAKLVIDDDGLTAAPLTPSEVLFTLLVPASAAPALTSGFPTVLVVDRDTAWVPWEAISPTDPTATMPPSVRGGFVRQLATWSPPSPRDASRDGALLIGETRLVGLPDLPGAREEIAAIERAMRAANLPVRVVHGESAPLGTSTKAIILREPARYLHIAGHGLADETGNAILLTSLDGASSTRLSAADILRMAELPWVVFLNACWSGKATPGHFQAEIASELIRGGVRCVVACGWSVGDGPAATFAKSFYRELLGGGSFGEAVIAGRRDAWELDGAHGHTWAAYQCYGDPSFRPLARAVAGTLGSATAVLERLDAAFAAAGSTGRLPPLVEALLQPATPVDLGGDAVLPAHIRTAPVLERAADVAAEVGEYAKARMLYREALALPLGPDDPRPSLRAMEQLANVLVRLARAALDAPPDKPREVDPPTAIAEALTLLDSLSRAGCRGEVMSLRGSALKVRARVSEDWKGDLRAAAEAYSMDPSLLPYAPWNLSTLYALLGDTAEAEAWDDVASHRPRGSDTRGDATLARELRKDHPNWGLVGRAYTARLEGASAREREAVTSHLAFVRDILARSGRAASDLELVRLKLVGG